jgi:hypothetical protein
MQEMVYICTFPKDYGNDTQERILKELSNFMQGVGYALYARLQDV